MSAHPNRGALGLTPEEKFMFDLEGYLVVKGVLNQDEVDEVNALADRVWPGG